MTDTTVTTDTTDESHVLRTLIKIVLVVGIVAAITKFMSDRRRDFYGLTEAEARSKFESKLGPIIGEDRASEVADQVIPRLKESGVLVGDAVDGAKKAASDMTDEIGVTAEKVAGDAKKATNSVKDTAEKIGKKID